MKYRQFMKYALMLMLLALLVPGVAAAYVGPGAGLSAVGVFLAVVAGVIVAIFGFIWYPFKRLMQKMKKPDKDT